MSDHDDTATLDLFDADTSAVPRIRRRRRNHSATSEDAIARAQPTMPRVRRIVRDAVAGSADGLTRAEVAAQTGIKLQSVCSAANHLLYVERVLEEAVQDGRLVKRDGGAVLRARYVRRGAA